MPLTIREATLDDLSRLPELFDYNDVRAMIAEHTRRITSGEFSIFLLWDGADLIGELHVTWHSDDHRFALSGQRAYLSAFRVLKGRQGYGFGTFLLQEVIRQIEGVGYREITVGVEDNNARAKHMYAKLGFSERIARCRESYQGDEYDYDLLLRRT